MPSAAEIDRIAAAMNAVRPDWRTSSLVTFLTKHHAGRAYRDLAIAAVAVATDPKTTTPNLLNEHGGWWVAAQAVVGAPSLELRAARCAQPGHTSYLASNCGACRSEQLALDDRETAARHALATQGVPRDAITRIRATLAAATAVEPDPRVKD